MTCCALVTCTQDRTRAVLAAEAADPRLKAACEERIKVLKDLVEVATRSYQSARADYQEVFDAQMQLAKAELEQAATQAERITHLEQIHELTKHREQIAQAQKDSGRGTHLQGLKATADRLAAEIALLRAKNE